MADRNKDTVMAVIVTYRPDLGRLRDNLAAIAGQAGSTVVIDNGSEDPGIGELCRAYKAAFFPLDRNKGIAYVLKKAMRIARARRMDWVLTLDQDSVAKEGLVENYLRYAGMQDIGAMTCIIRDRNFDRMDVYDTEAPVKIRIAITSGCFMSVPAYFATDGYDAGLFIDKVDYDISFSLLEKGYSLIRIPFEGLAHEEGAAEPHVLFGKYFAVRNHPAWRKYYIIRNAVIIHKKHPKLYPLGLLIYEMLVEAAYILLYEKEKGRKMRQWFRGLLHGVLWKRKRKY